MHFLKVCLWLKQTELLSTLVEENGVKKDLLFSRTFKGFNFFRFLPRIRNMIKSNITGWIQQIGEFLCAVENYVLVFFKEKMLPAK